MYNVFTDFHHAGLLNSLIMLFEGRLGGNLCRPIGTEWYKQGFWKIYDHPATVEQYLGINGATPDETPRLNDFYYPDLQTGFFGVYCCKDIDSGYFNKAITFEAFMNTKFDIVIASIPQHLEPFKRLCEFHPNHPKLIYQIGNAWNIPAGTSVKNVMASANVPYSGGMNFIRYHQEFDLNIFRPSNTKVLSNENIYSFVNCFSIQEHFKNDWQLFQEVEKKMSSWNFKAYGGQCRDGAAHGSQELADKMREAMFIWHTKNGGDGYGHVLFNSAAVGRPIITNKAYYRGKLGEKLMIDGETCIDINGLSVDEIINKISNFSNPELYQEMCINVYNNFRKYVDFDKEQKEIELFLAKLL
jgi:hypothetical protein